MPRQGGEGEGDEVEVKEPTYVCLRRERVGLKEEEEGSRRVREQRWEQCTHTAKSGGAWSTCDSWWRRTCRAVELGLAFLSRCCLFTLAEARPRWATLHPDNWTTLEVAEWLDTVATEYRLGQEAKVTLTDLFCDVDGRRLKAMTLEDFLHLDPRHGELLSSVFHNVALAGRFCSEGVQRHPPVAPEDFPSASSLAPIAEQQLQHGDRRPTGPRASLGTRPPTTAGLGQLERQERQPQGQVAVGLGLSGRYRHSSLPCPSRRYPVTAQESQQQPQQQQQQQQMPEQQQQQRTGRQLDGPTAYSRSYSS